MDIYSVSNVQTQLIHSTQKLEPVLTLVTEMTCTKDLMENVTCALISWLRMENRSAKPVALKKVAPRVWKDTGS
jgi:hypothetical protein